MSVNQTLDTIFSRTSYRGSFKEEPIPREDLTAIMEAGIAAPSGCNRAGRTENQHEIGLVP